MGSEMCIRDRCIAGQDVAGGQAVSVVDSGDEQGNGIGAGLRLLGCLLYTSDAADERSSVDLGGRRIIKKKHNKKKNNRPMY